jgi:ankyrin repeat protein
MRIRYHFAAGMGGLPGIARNAARIVVALWCAAWLVPVTTAHEPDQYQVPAGRTFADVGPDLSQWFLRAIDGGVNRTNEQIRAAIEQKRSEREIQRLQSAEQVAANVNAQFAYAVTVIEDMDAQFTSAKFAQRYPGQLPGYKSPPSLAKYLMYPLNPLRAWTCGSFRAYGVMVGSDKIGHFTDMGRHYYNAYSAARRAGKSEEQAVAAAVAVGTDDPIMSEKGVLGYMTAGAYSNADLAANFCGMMFYRNLTEPLKLKGVDRPPMLERDGAYWKIAPHVRPDADFWQWFMSDHFDETMNPSLYLDFMRSGIRDIARANSEAIINLRTDANGQRHSQRWFVDRTRELRTYWGVKYGHRGRDEDLVMIHETCFPAAPKDARQRDAIGRTALHRAVDCGDVQQVRKLLASGENVNTVVRSNEQASPDWGQTPLHFAARDGNADIAGLLIQAGADVNAQDDRGVTPLHRANENPQMIALLCDAGAKVNMADATGRTPLHWAARAQNSAALDQLVARRVDPNARDRDGRTPLFDAAATGDANVVAALLRGGADPNAVDRFRATTAHEAITARGASVPDVIDVLVRGGAMINARDDFGCTPLHNSVRRGDEAIVACLLDAGADANIADAYGATPLHLTASRGFGAMARVLISHGANVQARAAGRGTPIDVAMRTGHDQLAAAMRASTGPQNLSTGGR